jgi:hypothetical protein
MGPVERTLLVILFFVMIVVGSFLMFILSWDADSAEPAAALLRRLA